MQHRWQSRELVRRLITLIFAGRNRIIVIRRECTAITDVCAVDVVADLMRQRGERVERSFAHVYDTGGMRRTYLRRHPNILKRLLIHASGFNLGLVMRHLIGLGTPRGFQGRLAALISALLRTSRSRRVELAGHIR